MRIVIDMQGLQTRSSGHRGVGRYTENLIRNMIIEAAPQHEIYLALNGTFTDSIDSIRAKFLDILPRDRIVVWQNFFNAAARSGHSEALKYAGYVIREVFLNSFRPDIIFSTNLQEGLDESAPTSVHELSYPTLYCSTLHDLVPFYYEDRYLSDPGIRKWYTEKIEYAKASDLIIADSHATRSDILAKLDVSESKVFTIELGYDSAVFNATPLTNKEREFTLKKYELKNPFIFYVGGNDSHKNVERLISAFSQLPEDLRNSFDLVIGGKDFPKDQMFINRIEQLGIYENTILTGFIEDDDLPKLYKLCKIFVFPSTHEGFGLPALEAMACGAAVIGSGTSSIQEIINFKPAMFDPYEIDDIQLKLRNALSDVDLYREILENGPKQASRYSWTRSARELWTVFENATQISRTKGYRFDDPVQHVIDALAKHTAELDDNALADIAHSISETFPVPRTRKIYLDISSVATHDYKSGIQRVVRAIAAELVNNHPRDFEVELAYTSTSDMRFYAANEYSRRVFNAKVSPHDEEIEFMAGDILIYLDLHPGVAIAHREHNRYLRNKGISVYHVVYDLLPILKPESFWPELCREFRLWTDAVSVSNGALCISKSVADELKEYLDIFGERRSSKFKIGYFHLGADIENSAPTKGLEEGAESVLRSLDARKTFLMVGTIEPRKGGQQALAAFDKLWKQAKDVNLVFVGREGWGVRDFAEHLLSHKENGKRLFWLQGISDEYLKKVYSSSDCLIAASTGEGFGLPLIEAAQHKLPIIARDIPVFKEVAGEHAFYFEDNTEPDTMANAIDTWLKLQKSDRHPRADQMPWLTWRESADQFMNIVLNDDWEYLIDGHGYLYEGLKQSHASERLEWVGFSDAESDFRWSSTASPGIRFLWGGQHEGTLLIKCTPLGTQRVTIYLNTRKIYSGVLSGANTEIFCSMRDLDFGENEIRFELPDAQSPGGADVRLLAIAIRSFEIGPTLPQLKDNSVYNHSSNEFIWDGFSGAEKEFRWTEERHARLIFNWKGTDRKKRLEIRCKTLDVQRITVLLNEREIYTGELSGDDLVVSTDVAEIKGGFNTLSLLLPDARRPNDADPRTLAIALKDIVFVDESRKFNYGMES
ncbi:MULTISPECIES: glycosyltransferase family 4 protein [Burkholderia cepacia complex]|uniref:Glycosyltransferase family 1 protein n=1 Tax=Burkholderia cenocepacia TaxID=95486 RepID=A0A3R9B7V5_9BURK|nr:glycosyltransferase family 1 protein [Burkholderia cenocepacia]RSC13354.1 glycosyltransferase family 1 protein [Burkholderia cenocepacia]